MMIDMRFSLRTLLILMLIAGPLSLLGWNQWHAYQRRLELERARKLQVSTRQRIIITGPTWIIGGASGSPAEQDIWQQQRDKISWESFPESQPDP
jgi:hypothetical protein